MSDSMKQHSVGFADLQAAAERIGASVLRTPLVACEFLSNELGCEIRFKAENLQPTGSFKDRGANNAVLSLPEEDLPNGVVTHSSGNHAAALARAAKRRGIPAHIVMPDNAVPNKLAAVKALGVQPILCPPDSPSRLAKAEAVQAETGARMVSPFNDPRIIAGQGTAGLEILQQWPDVDVILAPVGGGGLLSGVLMMKQAHPDLQVIAIEPAQADDAYRSLQSGSIEMPTRYDTIADGLRTVLGTLTFPIIQQYLDDLWLVEETAIMAAVRTLIVQARLVAEPSGAVTLAGLVNHAEKLRGKRVALIISGGNIDLGHCMVGKPPQK